jgi:hypothetical protein
MSLPMPRPSFPAKDWRSVLFSTPASGTIAKRTRRCSSSAVARWFGPFRFLSRTRTARFRNLATPHQWSYLSVVQAGAAGFRTRWVLCDGALPPGFPLWMIPPSSSDSSGLQPCGELPECQGPFNLRAAAAPECFNWLHHPFLTVEKKLPKENLLNEKALAYRTPQWDAREFAFCS